MIILPKKSVTRFFVPLIDVLILLFCIFLLMPFVSTGKETDEPKDEAKAAPPAPLSDDVRELQIEVLNLRRQNEHLKVKAGNLSDHLSVKVLEIDPANGRLYYIQDGERLEVTTQAAAETVITLHQRQAGRKEPFFLLLYPRKRSGYPEQQQADDYAKWFRNVQFQFDRPFAP